jgi:hypothetical protein
MIVGLGPTLLVLGSVQTFCIDPLKEVFGVVEMAAGAGGGGEEWVALFRLQQFRSERRKGQPPDVHTTCYDVHACEW